MASVVLLYTFKYLRVLLGRVCAFCSLLCRKELGCILRVVVGLFSFFFFFFFSRKCRVLAVFLVLCTKMLART